MIVVPDTNVLISGILWSGPPHEIIRRAEHGEFVLASSRPLITELFDVLARPKFQKHLMAANTDLATIRAHMMELVRLYAVRHTVTVITADPPDNAVLACALSAKACAIISGDDHLLALRQFEHIPILTPRRFLATLKPVRT